MSEPRDRNMDRSSELDRVLNAEELMSLRDQVLWPFGAEEFFLSPNNVGITSMEDVISGLDVRPNLIIVEAARGYDYEQWVAEKNPKGIQYMRISYGIPSLDVGLLNGMLSIAYDEMPEIQHLTPGELKRLKAWRFREFEFWKTRKMLARDDTYFQIRNKDHRPITGDINYIDIYNRTTLEARRSLNSSMSHEEAALVERGLQLIR